MSLIDILTLGSVAGSSLLGILIQLFEEEYKEDVREGWKLKKLTTAKKVYLVVVDTFWDCFA